MARKKIFNIHQTESELTLSWHREGKPHMIFAWDMDLQELEDLYHLLHRFRKETGQIRKPPKTKKS